MLTKELFTHIGYFAVAGNPAIFNFYPITQIRFWELVNKHEEKKGRKPVTFFIPDKFFDKISVKQKVSDTMARIATVAEDTFQREVFTQTDYLRLEHPENIAEASCMVRSAILSGQVDAPGEKVVAYFLLNDSLCYVSATRQPDMNLNIAYLLPAEKLQFKVARKVLHRSDQITTN